MIGPRHRAKRAAARPSGGPRDRGSAGGRCRRAAASRPRARGPGPHRSSDPSATRPVSSSDRSRSRNRASCRGARDRARRRVLLDHRRAACTGHGDGADAWRHSAGDGRRTLRDPAGERRVADARGAELDGPSAPAGSRPAHAGGAAFWIGMALRVNLGGKAAAPSICSSTPARFHSSVEGGAAQIGRSLTFCPRGAVSGIGVRTELRTEAPSMAPRPWRPRSRRAACRSWRGSTRRSRDARACSRTRRVPWRAMRSPAPITASARSWAGLRRAGRG